MEKLQHVSHREKRETMTEALKEYVNPLIADMYQTALNLFPARTLEEMRVVIKEDSGDFRGGEGEQDGEKVPMIVIGVQETLASPNLIARMSSRLGIPRESLENERTGRRVVGLVAFCHELGHIIQLDDKVMRAFGEIDNTIVPLPMDYHLNNTKHMSSLIVKLMLITSQLVFWRQASWVKLWVIDRLSKTLLSGVNGSRQIQ